VALIAGGNEFASGTCQVKNLQTGEKRDISIADNAAEIVAEVKKILG
jgi:histidyl-tRNA synthetase